VATGSPLHIRLLHVPPCYWTQVRLQQPGSPYSSSSAVIAAVLRADGVRGLWKGATPGVVSAWGRGILVQCNRLMAVADREVEQMI
jgi:hypothetical protein